MKARLSLLIVLMTATVFSYGQQYSNLSFSPAQPKPGDKIHFEYSTEGTVLGGEASFDAIAYLSDGEVRAQELKLEGSGTKWSGDIETNDSTKAVFLVFKKDETIDNNKDRGYYLLMYSDGEPVKGAYIAVAEFNSGYGSFLANIKSEPAASLELYNKDFSRYPDLKAKNLASYIGLLVRVDKATAKEKAQPLIDELEAKNNKTESDYQSLINSYQRLGDMDASGKLKEEAIKKFPKGSLAKNKALDGFYNETDLKKREGLLTAYLKNYPPKTVNEKNTASNLYNTLASSAVTAKDWTLFRKFASHVTNKEMLALSYNRAASQLTGEDMEAKVSPADLRMARDFSTKAVSLIKESLNKPVTKPAFYTVKEYKKNLLYYSGMIGDTYALALWKSGKKNEALKTQEAAVKDMEFQDPDANERYIVYKENIQGPGAVKKEIEDYVKDGKSSAKMKEILKKAYLSEGHTEAEYTSYMDELVKEYKAKLREEVIKKMINETAPQFALQDFSGNTVSLADLKGKVVVADFWATWCGPCKASFPAMQTAVTNFKDDPDVKFVFVDSWESKKPDEMLKGADEFIKKNNYTFHVLLDTEDKVIGSYGVDGIPTKFVIDPAGNIRFKSIGYDGNPDRLVDELSAVIDVLKSGAVQGTQKAF